MKSKVNIPPKAVVTLERKGFVLIHVGDVVMNKMQSLLQYIKVKQFDHESWYLYRSNYVVTDIDIKFMSYNCKYNGNL